MFAQKLSMKRSNRACAFKKLLVYSLCFGLVFWGLPMDRILMAEEGPVKRIVIDQTTGPNPDPGGFRHGQPLTFKAIVLDEKGYSIDPNDPACGGIVFEMPKTVAGEILVPAQSLEGAISPGPGGLSRVGKTIASPNGLLHVVIGKDKGGQPIEAHCKNQPKVKGLKLVTGSGGASMAKDSFDRPPLAKEFTPPPSPAGTAGTPPSTAPKASSGGGDAALIAGVAVAGALALAAGAAAAGGAGGGGGGSSSASSNCHCNSSAYYCSASFGSACCSKSLGQPYYASDGKCYSSIFGMPSNVRYVMCGGC